MKRFIVDVKVNPREGGWDVDARGEEGGHEHFERKEEAVQHAREIAKQHIPSQVVIRRHDGKIQEERTYGNDPRRHPG
jgi:hypothetical protein